MRGGEIRIALLERSAALRKWKRQTVIWQTASRGHSWESLKPLSIRGGDVLYNHVIRKLISVKASTATKRGHSRDMSRAYVAGAIGGSGDATMRKVWLC